MAKGENNTPRTRKAKAESGDKRVIKGKYAQERGNVPPVVPKNARQRLYMDYLENFPMVMATGYAGTSKTYIPTCMACDDFRNGYVEKIILTRPAVSNSKSLGFFSGDIIEKSMNWLGPVLDIMNKRMGRAALEIAIKNGDICFVPFEVIKGYSFSDAWVICDEAEDITIDEAKKFVTRIGENSKVVLAGDLLQSELKDKSGLKFLVDTFNKSDRLKDKVAHVDFCYPEDIVRSDLCRDWVLELR